MRGAVLGACLLLAASVLAASPAGEAWRSFEGSWSVTGHRELLATEGARPAAILRLSGAVVLTGGEGLSRGFRGEAIGFDDGGSVHLGRSVWTDDRGDRIFLALEGEPLERGGRLSGRITGGSGRYAGLQGDFELVWQYVVSSEDGTFQARTTSLKGRCLPREGPP
jgi:hypothetical protein